jgi:CheY-like chemotaxis protein
MLDIRKPKVLAVDDVRANLIALEAVLHREYEVVFANGGREALAQLTRDPDVDVILMDIQMPGMDGYEAAAAIRKLPGCAEIPLIFVSAIFTEDPHMRRGYEAGAVDYFAKPLDPDILRKKIGVYASYRHRAAVLRERERQVRESEHVLNAAKKLSAMLDGFSVGVIVAGLDGHILQTNETSGYDLLLGWWDPEGRRLAGKGDSLTQALEHGLATDNEARLIQASDGSARLLYLSTSPMRNRGNVIVGAVIVVRDVTEHRKCELDLHQRISSLVANAA